ncbi:MAG: CorA family divalent cation transporter [Candidatus Paceibacterota bacterium]
MLKKYTYKKLTWIDLENPTSDDIKEVMEEYSLAIIVADELMIPSPKSKVDLYSNYIYLVLHFPPFRYINANKHGTEIDFIISKNFIITTHYGEVEPLHNFSKIFEVSSRIDHSNIGDHAGFIFYYMIREIYHSLESEINYIEKDIKDIEEKIFEGEEREMVSEISQLSRDLLDFKQASSLHKSVLESFVGASKKFFGESFSYHSEAILNEYLKIKQAIQDNKEFLDELRTTNDSLLTTKQNETMKVLTILAFVTFPLSLVASIFGMNTTHLPIIGMHNDFWIIMGIMLAIITVMFGFFKYKKWL